jgi:carbonic anhydrase/acetyltransferase-like protein (isoleucine patch superfamily)
VVIGERSFVSTNCVILKGAFLPPRSLLAAHSTLIKATDHKAASGLYVGTPAKCIAPVPSGSDTYFERKVSEITKLRADMSLGQLD